MLGKGQALAARIDDAVVDSDISIEATKSGPTYHSGVSEPVFIGAPRAYTIPPSRDTAAQQRALANLRKAHSESAPTPDGPPNAGAQPFGQVNPRAQGRPQTTSAKAAQPHVDPTPSGAMDALRVSAEHLTDQIDRTRSGFEKISHAIGKRMPRVQLGPRAIHGAFYTSMGALLASSITQGLLGVGATAMQWSVGICLVLSLVGSWGLLANAQWPTARRVFSAKQLANWTFSLGEASLITGAAHFAVSMLVLANGIALPLATQALMGVTVLGGITYVLPRLFARVSQQAAVTVWLHMGTVTAGWAAFSTLGGTVLAWWAAPIAVSYLVWFAYRIGIHVRAVTKYRLHVEHVERAADGAVLLTVVGEDLDRLTRRKGEIFTWRVLVRDQWRTIHRGMIRPSAQPHVATIALSDADPEGDLDDQFPTGAHVAFTWPAIRPRRPKGSVTPQVARFSRAVVVVDNAGASRAIDILSQIQDRFEEVRVVFQAYGAKDRIVFETLRKLCQSRQVDLGVNVVRTAAQRGAELHRLVGLVPDMEQREIFIAAKSDSIRHVASMARSLQCKPEHFHVTKMP